MSDPVELPKTMLIIKSNATALATVETFLRNRGWKIYSTANMKDALVQLVQNKPSYVLISVDHPNKKVRTLPKLLKQAFPVVCMAFAENQNSVSYKLLNDSATDYRVYPPITGPAIERCVNKYAKDQATRETVAAANDQYQADQDDKANDRVSIKGNGLGSVDVRGRDGGLGTDAAAQLLSQFMNEDITAGIQEANAAKAKAQSGVLFAQTADEDVSITQSGPGAGNLGSAHQKGPGMGKAMQETQVGPKNDLLSSESGGGPVGDLMSAKNGGPKNDLLSAGGDSDSDLDSDSVDAVPLGSREYRRSHANGPGWAPGEKAEGKDIVVKQRRPSLKDDSLIVRGAQKSLEESLNFGDGVVKQKVEESTNMACIMVDSERFSGYLVAVMGKDQKIDGKFMDLIKNRLFRFLKENGESASETDSLGLKIKQVDFEPWAVEYADFMKKSVHEGSEVAMAFFPRENMKTVLEDSAHHEMSKIDLKQLQGNSPVEFDLYVYLPTNNKYVLYTPKGGVFYSKQLDRLKQQGVTHMHVQKDAASDISKYHAQNYLNGLVEEHEEKQSKSSKHKVKAS